MDSVCPWHRRVLRRLDGEDGVSLPELMVAIFVLMIVMVGFTASTISAIVLSSNNRHRVVAANIADERMSTLRTLDFEDVPQSTIVEAVDRGGISYELVQTATMVQLNATDNSCDSPAPIGPGGSQQPAYLQAIVEVSWNRMDGIEPVRSETIINPPVSAYSAYLGHIAVKVTGEDLLPIQDATVTVTPLFPGGTSLGPKPTLSNGCVFFAGLEPGEYEIKVSKANHVDLGGNPEPIVTQVVVPATTFPVEFKYDEYATLDLSFAGAYGGVVPADIPLTLRNDNAFAPGPDAKIFSDLLVTPLYPFNAGYDAWAGQCGDADPRATGATPTNVPSLAGETTAQMVPMGTANLLFFEEGNPENNQTLIVVATNACDADPDRTLTLQANVTTDAAGAALLALPYGRWTIQVQGAAPDGDPEWPFVVLTPADEAAPTVEVRFDD